MNIDPARVFDPLDTVTTNAPEAASVDSDAPSRGEAAWASASSSASAGHHDDNRTKTSGWNKGFLLRRSSLSKKKLAHLKKTARITPWYDEDERCRVGRGLLLASKLFPAGGGLTTHHADGEDVTAELRDALRCIALWRSRCGGGSGVSLPHAIDATATLASALYEDLRVAQREMSTTLHQLRNAYSSAIIRSVNGLADSYRRQANDGRMSVMQCCALAGLPSWIVDVRHDASHSALPSLCVCRVAAIESLNFWRRHYWDKQTRGEELVDTAMSALIGYQKAAMTELLVAEGKQRQHPKQQRRQNVGITMHDEKEGMEERVSNPTKVAVGTNKPVMKIKKDINDEGGDLNPWSILMDDKPKKKRKKQDINKEKEEVINANGDFKDGAMTEAMVDREKGDGGNADPPGTASSTANTNSPAPTVRDCALEFVKKIPMDVAYSTALRFLVWGRPLRMKTAEDDKIDNGPALLTLPSVTSHVPHRRLPSTLLERETYDLSFERLRTMYDPLLIAMTTTYPGFLPALVVHIIDAILSLVGAQRENSECNRGYEERQSRLAEDGENQDEKCDGKLDLMRLVHHVQHLSRWVRYFLSRAFHMHFDKLVASWYDPVDDDGTVAEISQQGQHQSVEPSLPCKFTRDTKLPAKQQQGQPIIDLKKRGRKKWTAAQHIYMQSPLEYLYLHKTVGLPLNSVCDRLLLFRQQQGCSYSATTSEHNTVFASLSSSHVTKTAATICTDVVGQLHQYLEDVIGKKERIIFMGLYDDNDNHDKIPTSVNDDCSKDRSEPSPPQNNMQKNKTLEEMEAIVEGSVRTMSDINEDSSPVLTSPSTPCNESSTRERIDYMSRPNIKPWTLCKGWDACAIGTMPGHPS